MTTIPQPAIGDWYRNPGGMPFEVVAYDDDDGTIEIQYFDGTIVAASINDDVFDIWITLQKHRSDCFLNKMTLIITGGYDTNFGPRLGIYRALPHLVRFCGPGPSSFTWRRGRQIAQSAIRHNITLFYKYF